MYTKQQLLDGSTPSNWTVLSNNGTTLTAVNNITKETFTGTPTAFKALTSVSGTFGDPEPVFNSDGSFGGFRHKGVEFPTSGSGVGVSVLSAASAGQDSGWIAYTPGMRLAYALDSGSTTTTFSVDISNDGSTSLGQAFTGTWASTTAEISPPIWLTNTQARYIRFNVLSGGPLSVIRF